jgi:predicted ATPase
MSPIRTPDQRLRVFISSTLQELAPERAAARKAVEGLRMSPILFESGARPHPPRELYRAYLEQSDIFIGIYWASYGWVAPEMEISGLEDEYHLAAGKPKLIYVKAPADGREKRLKELLDHIASDGVSYRTFARASELRQLVENDLALMLTEHFQSAGTKIESALVEEEHDADALPAAVDAFVGRGRELEILCDALSGEGDRLITLTGPGGIGKTRLAIEAARRSPDAFEHGVHLVTLASITQSEVVIPTIVRALKVQGSTNEPLLVLIAYLRERNLLLILDNFEQVIFAAPEIARVVEECRSLKVLVTSRSVLNLRGEREIQVPPLAVPDGSNGEVEDSEAVLLFVERARAINAGFTLTKENASTVAEITRRLDGLPLALELAAARTRLLSPQAMLARLDASLQFLTHSSRDVPERHQTLRAAIDWSFGLLNEQEQKLFVRLAAFHGGCTLEAAEDVCNPDGDLDVLELLTSLLEKSLIKHEFRENQPRFSMLRTVWEYATDRLSESDEADAIRNAHCDFFLALVAGAHKGLRSPGQTEWLMRLETDHDNLRAALRSALDAGATEAVADAGWTIWLFWWLDSHLAEGRQLMTEVLERSDLSDLGRARATAVAGCMAFWQSDYAIALPFLSQALESFRESGELSGVALCQLPLAFADAAVGDARSARERFQESIRYFKDVGDQWGTVLCMNSMCWTSNAVEMYPGDDIYEEAVERAEKLGTRLEIGMALRNLGSHRSDQGRMVEAKDLLRRALETLWRGYVRGGASYTIDAIGELATREGAFALATTLFGAMDGVREVNQAPIIPMLVPRMHGFLDRLRRDLGDEAYERAWAGGRSLGLDEATALALAWARGEISDVPGDEVAATK